MVLKVIQKSTVEDDKFYVGVGIPETPFYQTDPWFRNPCWLPLPTVTSTEQKFVGLLAIDPEVNDVRLFVEMDTSLDSFRVDWGDGVVENFIDPATNLSAVVQHSYDYNNILFDGTDAPVTFTASTNTVNRTNHGHTNGMFITFAEVVTTPEINRNRTYWVVNATTNTFQISTTKNGTPLDFTVDGSGKILPYKQVIVTVTPIQGRILSINLSARHTNLAGPAVIYDIGWLDITVSLPYANSIIFSSATNSTRLVSLNRVEQISLLNAGVSTNLLWLFFALVNLQSIPVLHVPDTVTSLTNLFNTCRRLKTIPSFSTKNVQDVTSMFANCTSLEVAPFLDLKSCYLTASMFSSCHSLKSVPLYDTSNVYNMNGMFQNCYNLKQIPQFDTSSVRFMSDMFNACTSLELLPHLETARVADFTRTFQSCYMLRTIQGLDTRTAVNTSSMFTECHKLKIIPNMDMRNVVNSSSMFSSCFSLVKLPEMEFASLVNASSMFINCYALEDIDNLVISSPNLTSLPSMFSGCYSLEKAPVMNTAKVISVDSMFYVCARLVQVPDMDLSSCIDFSLMFVNCFSLERAPRMITTATGSGNPYVKQMDSIFSGCNNLKYVPPFDTSKASTVSGMFQSCYNLEVAPEFDLSMCTNAYRMYRDCYNLKKVGKLSNTTNITTFGEIFYLCNSLNEIPEMNCNGITSALVLTSAFLACNSAVKFNATNLKYTFSVADLKLSATALNDLYTSLPTVTGQTLTVTGNWGTATDNPSIATAKGWTVTG